MYAVRDSKIFMADRFLDMGININAVAKVRKINLIYFALLHILNLNNYKRCSNSRVFNIISFKN